MVEYVITKNTEIHSVAFDRISLQAIRINST